MIKIRLFRNIKDLHFNKHNNNLMFITGLSGSGKSYLSKQLSIELNAKVFQPEWLIHYKHTDETFKPFLDNFISKHNIKTYVDTKWNNEKNEDNNELLKKYINLLVKDFIEAHKKDKENYIIEGLQLFTLIDFETIKDYPIIIKGTSSIKSLSNRIKRDYEKRKNLSLTNKLKWLFKVLKQSRLYQFKHRKKLNNFIKLYNQ